MRIYSLHIKCALPTWNPTPAFAVVPTVANNAIVFVKDQAMETVPI